MSFLYIGTFGSFIGFGFAFGQVLLVQFPEHFSHMVIASGVPTRVPDPVGAAHFTFLGPLIGSLARPIGGFLADRFGGAFITFWNFVLMTSAAIVVLLASKQHSLGLFLVGFCLLFTFAGVGNGSTYKMIPAIFKARALLTTDGGGDHSTAEKKSRRHAGALIGIAGAIGAFGGVLVNIAFRQSFLHDKNGNAAYISFIVFYGLCFALTWLVYLRKSEKRLVGV
jgi:NNP family nitrate/nitrite transporter-like MFS transporter